MGVSNQTPISQVSGALTVNIRDNPPTAEDTGVGVGWYGPLHVEGSVRAGPKE